METLEYAIKFNEALLRQPRLWEPSSITVADETTNSFPLLSELKSIEVSDGMDLQNPGIYYKVKPKKYGLCARWDKKPLPEDLARYLDSLLWDLCKGLTINSYTADLINENDLPQVNRLIIRKPWVIASEYDPIRDKRLLSVKGMYGVIPISIKGVTSI